MRWAAVDCLYNGNAPQRQAKLGYAWDVRVLLNRSTRKFITLRIVANNKFVLGVIGNPLGKSRGFLKRDCIGGRRSAGYRLRIRVAKHRWPEPAVRRAGRMLACSAPSNPGRRDALHRHNRTCHRHRYRWWNLSTYHVRPRLYSAKKSRCHWCDRFRSSPRVVPSDCSLHRR